MVTIDDMPAGREMDVLIVKTIPMDGVFISVVGPDQEEWAWWHEKLSEDQESGWKQEFRPSTDIAATWQVVETMQAGGDCLSLIWQTGIDLRNLTKRAWSAEWRIAGRWACADTAPLAICRATRKALGVKWEDYAHP